MALFFKLASETAKKLARTARASGKRKGTPQTRRSKAASDKISRKWKKAGKADRDRVKGRRR